MAHYETIFKNGTLVNQDGVHLADIGVVAGRIAALGDLGASSADEYRRLHRSPSSFPASSIRRCISASRG